MTFSKFNSLFLGEYPTGRAWAHDAFEHDVPGRKQKVTVEFQPGGKAYMFRGAYEDILCKIGINVISKERFAELETRLSRLREMNGTEDGFFGIVFDCTAEIDALVEEIEKYRTEYIIV